MRISVIIPVYNKAPYLEKCLNSVINQTYKGLEILLINDGSTDNSLEICNNYCQKDDRIQLFDQENRGVSAARNLGIEKAKGEWIYFLDADDYLELNAFEQLISEANLNSKVDVLHFGIRAIKDNIIQGEKCPSKKTLLNSLEGFLSSLELRPVSCCLYLIKSKIVKDNNMLFDITQTTGEDKIFISEVFMRASSFLILDKIFYNQILSPNSLSRSALTKEKVLSNLRSQSKIIRKAKSLDKTKAFQPEINRGLRSFFGALLHYSQNNRIDEEIKDAFKEFCSNNNDVFTTPISKVAKFNLSFLIFCYKTHHKILQSLKIRG